jgi:sodium-dependent phosphate transporter
LQLVLLACAALATPVAAVFEQTSLQGDVEAYQSEYLWIAIVGCFAAFFMAWGIGANDVANSFASSVGSKSLTLKQAVAIASVMEFVGCVAMGASVTDTVRKGILDSSFLKENPEILQLAMLSALLGAGTWLLVCSILGSPVSTTHSIIGSLIGVSLCVNPASLNGPTIGLVVLSWVTSPVLSGIIGATVFLFVRTAILRSDNPVARGYALYPVLLFFTFEVICLYTTFKNPQVDLKAWRGDYPGYAVLAATGVALLLAGVIYATTVGYVKRQTEAMDEQEGGIQVDVEAKARADAEVEAKADGEAEAKAEGASSKKAGGFVMPWNRDLHAAGLEEDAGAAAVDDEAEKFPAKAEKLFNYLQVISACFDSLAHGANDVANSVGPLAAIMGIHSAAKVDSKVDVPIWILVLGGVGITIGLLTYGYNVIKSIGIKLTKITPARGFCIEMGSSIVVIVGSNLGIPLSTTHCQVGATVGVGMCEINGAATAKRGVNWKLMGKVFSMWVLTLVFAAVCSSAIFTVMASAYRPMTQALPCGKIQSHLSSLNVAGRAIADKASMKALFKTIDADGDSEIDSDELKKAADVSDMALDGKKKLVEVYGRRRRRTPSTMTESDFLQYTCVSNDNLEHMHYTKCEPRCNSGLRADKELQCKLNPANTDSAGNFMIATYYSGFSNCVSPSR